jgi:uncharacterized protein
MRPAIASCLILLGLVATSGHSAAWPQNGTVRHNCNPATISSAPQNTGQISDGANIFSKTGRVKMLRAIRDFEHAHRLQLAVVSVKSLAGQDVADYTCTLANAWAVGDPDRDDGMVILIAPYERRIRIAIGVGLEEKLSDDFLKEVIDQKIIPQFPEKRYSIGIINGITAISKKLNAR